MQAFRYVAEVDAEGKVALPAFALEAGTSIEIIVLVPQQDAETDALLAASASSLEFWDNAIDDAIWNNA